MADKPFDIQKLNYDELKKDYTAVRMQASGMWLSDQKAPMTGDWLGSTRQDYLDAIQALATDQRSNFDGALGGWLMFGKMANVSANFKTLIREVGLEKGVPGYAQREALFKDAFDAAFKTPEDLKNPAILYQALEAGFIEAAGGKDTGGRERYYAALKTAGYIDENAKPNPNTTDPKLIPDTPDDALKNYQDNLSQMITPSTPPEVSQEVTDLLKQTQGCAPATLGTDQLQLPSEVEAPLGGPLVQKKKPAPAPGCNQ